MESAHAMARLQNPGARPSPAAATDDGPRFSMILSGPAKIRTLGMQWFTGENSRLQRNIDLNARHPYDLRVTSAGRRNHEITRARP
jgi:hypothetical protein